MMGLMSFFFTFLLSFILFFNQPLSVHCDEEEDLLQGINKYRSSINLTSLTENKNADCLAGEIADELKGQPCTNTTGANTVPGTEPQFSNYPVLLSKCQLNISNTRDGSIMPACVPGLTPNIVLSNFTQSLYSANLNDSKYTGIGIGAEDNWIVVVLTTNTSSGSFSPATSDHNAANLLPRFGWIYTSLFFLLPNIYLFSTTSSSSFKTQQ
ncbi:unnamed protein product [Lupinus luteus]|uniref:Uncharacterized GPI-anchored protein At5g19230-like domain-containing protein n=1 Tax=Lupinus luteus TaxID=3873 RepID=A0AAV1YGN3_LUPLU